MNFKVSLCLTWIFVFFFWFLDTSFFWDARTEAILNVPFVFLEVSRIKYELYVFLINNWNIRSYYLQFCYFFEGENEQLKLLNRRCCQNYLTTWKLLKFVNSTKHYIKWVAYLPEYIPLIHKRRNAKNRVQKSIKKVARMVLNFPFLFKQNTPEIVHRFRSRHRWFAFAEV